MILRTMLCWGVCLAFACTDESAPPEPLPAESTANKPNIFLVTVDTLRADHTTVHGYARNTTPWLDAIAKQGAVFEQALSPAAWTPPAMASIMTGTYPFQHQIDNGAKVGAKSFNLPVLSKDHHTLAEHLQEAGYRTVGVTTNFHLAPKMGFDQGFDEFIALGMVDDARKAGKAVQSIAGSLGPEQPWFLWVHILDPHGPYFSNEPFASQYDRELESRFDGVAESRQARFKRHRTQYVREMENDPSTHAGSLGLATLEALYDSEVQFVDGIIAKLTKTVPVDGNTMFVLTSDHGEEFREHGNLGHRRSLFQDQIHVPWVMVWPGVIQPSRITTPVTTVDLMPTVVELVTGFPPKEAVVTGKSHARALQEGARPIERDLYSELRVANQYSWAVIRGGRKLINEVDAKHQILVDFASDPTESVPIKESAESESMENSWLEARKSWPVLKAGQVHSYASDEQIERLEALGYVDEAAPR